MAAEEPRGILFEVDKILDKRRNRRGKLEYRVRWKGYGFDEDTWEPETHLAECTEIIEEFNLQLRERQRDNSLIRSTRGSQRVRTIQSPTCSSSDTNGARKRIRPHSSSLSVGQSPLPGETENTFPISSTNQEQQQRCSGVKDCNTDMYKHRHQQQQQQQQQQQPPTPASPPNQNYRQLGADTHSVAGSGSTPSRNIYLRHMDLAKSGIKILVPKSPMNTRADSEESPSEAAQGLEQGGQEPDSVPPEVAFLEMSPGCLLSPGEERARMGTRPRRQTPLSAPEIPITPAAMHALNREGNSTFVETPPANGTASLPSAVTPVASSHAGSGKRRFEERTAAFDKRLRVSVRQTESAYRYRDIVVKKQDGFTHILFSTKSTENNSLNPEVMKEVQSAMATAAADDSKLLLLGGVGSVFCSGLDLMYLIRRLTDDRKKESARMAETIRTFVNTFIQFKKPIVVAVNGPAIGLGASILPLCDVIWANEKAWLQTPYTSIGQTPDACSSITFPLIMGVAAANEVLLSGRKLTAQEACAKGLVSQVLWPGTFMQEVKMRIKELVTCNSIVLRESKALVRNSSRGVLEQANERECEALKRVWGSTQGLDSILKYLQNKTDEF